MTESRCFQVQADVTNGTVTRYRRYNPDMTVETVEITDVIGKPVQYSAKHAKVKPEYTFESVCDAILALEIKHRGASLHYREVPPSKFPHVPDTDELTEYMCDAVCPTVTGCCDVEPDCERCEHGQPSWLVALGLI